MCWVRNVILKEGNAVSSFKACVNAFVKTNLELAVESLDSGEESTKDLQGEALLDTPDPHLVHITQKQGPTYSPKTPKFTDEADSALRRKGSGDYRGGNHARFPDPCIVQQTPKTIMLTEERLKRSGDRRRLSLLTIIHIWCLLRDF